MYRVGLEVCSQHPHHLPQHMHHPHSWSLPLSNSFLHSAPAFVAIIGAHPVAQCIVLSTSFDISPPPSNLVTHADVVCVVRCQGAVIGCYGRRLVP